MRDNLYFLLDVSIYIIQGLLLVMLLKTAWTRFTFKRLHTAAAILLIQYVAVQIFLHYSDVIKGLLYGESQLMNSSRQSIIPVLISMFITCTVSIFLLKESRLKIIYYIVTFYSVTELLKFAVYPALLWLLDKLMYFNQYLLFDRQLYDEQTFYKAVLATEFLWNMFYGLIISAALYLINKCIKKYVEMKENYQRPQLIFLLVPSVTGILLCMIIRSIMFSMQEDDIYSLLESRPEMNVLIPCVSLLCILLIILVAKMLKKLIDESNKRIEVSVYQERIKEMEQHIGDIESLYAGIRGMKHDMKNYIADIEALINTKPENKADNSALKQYLNSLQTSVEQLDIKHNTGNPVTDVIIQRYVKLAENNGIDFQTDFLFPANMNIDAFDISIIINNALDNAVQACKRQKEGKKTIVLNAYRRENMFFIIIKNSFDGVVIKDTDSERFLTTKEDNANHGLGLRNIEVCAQKYYGKAEAAVKGNEFELAVMLQKGVNTINE